MPLNLEILAKQLIPFDGSKEKLFEFIRVCETTLELAQEGDRDTLFQLIKLKLTGKAFRLTKHRNFDDFDALKIHLEEVFSDKRSQAQWELELHTCKQNSHEDVMSYSHRVESILEKLTDSVVVGIQEPEIVEAYEDLLKNQAKNVFILGLREPILTQVKARNPNSLENAIALAVAEERELLSRNEVRKYQVPHTYNQPRFRNTNQNSYPRNYNMYNNFSQNRYHNPQIKREINTVNNFNRNPNQKCNDQNNYFNNVRPVNSSKPFSSNNNFQGNNNICAYCKLKGHHIKDCRKRMYNENLRNSGASTSNGHNLNSQGPLASGQPEKAHCSRTTK